MADIEFKQAGRITTLQLFAVAGFGHSNAAAATTLIDVHKNEFSKADERWSLHGHRILYKWQEEQFIDGSLLGCIEELSSRYRSRENLLALAAAERLQHRSPETTGWRS